MILLWAIGGCLGCSNVSTWEYSWQAMHLIDVAQTYHAIGEHPHCFEELDPLTKNVMGKHPSKSDILQWGIASSIVHIFLGKWVDKKFKKSGKYIRSVDTAYKLGTIVGNHSRGLYVDGISDKEKKRCNDVLEMQSVSLELMRF